MDKNSMPIAVIDSGVGGVSVLKQLVELMPYENYLYFGDNKNAPYGTKTAKEVLELMLINAETVLNKGAKAIVIACNTATAAAAFQLRQKYPDIPIIGIEPAIKPSASYKEHSNVLVMATPLTVKQNKFLELVDRFSDEVNIYPLPCPGLMELIEEGKTEGEELKSFLDELLVDFKNRKIDSVVLGCTHYPHVKDAISDALGGNVMIFDGGEGTAKETKRRLEEKGLLNRNKEQGKLIIENSAKNSDFERLVMTLLKEKK